MAERSLWRWSILILAVIVWGFPLSVLGDRLGYGAEPGWLAAMIGVVFGDLFCCIWWLGLTAEPRRRTPGSTNR
jgi:hypothetical protein